MINQRRSIYPSREPVQTNPATSRLRAGVRFGYRKTTTSVAGLRRSGMIALMVLDGPINREAFLACVDQVLAPASRPGDVVFMDSLSSHEGADMRELIEAARPTLRFLPPDSPDFNPIEQAFSKLKAYLREATERIIHRLWSGIGRILDLYSPAECANYFAARGYGADWSKDDLIFQVHG